MTICLLLVSCAVWVGFIQSEALVIALRCRLDLPGPFRLHPNFIIIGLLPLAGLAALLAFWRPGARTTENQPGRIASLLASFPFNPSDFPFPGRSPGAWDPSGFEPHHGPCLRSIMSEDGMAMIRRSLAILVMLGLTAVTIAGCESLRQAIRSGSDDHAQKSVKPTSGVAEASAVESDPSKLQAVDSDTKNPQPFFKNNRPSGGWSSEAREIESHLGVGP